MAAKDLGHFVQLQLTFTKTNTP